MEKTTSKYIGDAEIKPCPLCGANSKQIPNSLCISYTTIRCDKCGSFIIHDTVYREDKSIDMYQRLNLVYEFLLTNPSYKNLGTNKYYTFQFIPHADMTIHQSDTPSNKINIALFAKDYPKKLLDKIDRILLSLSIKLPKYGDELTKAELPFCERLFFCESRQNGSSIENKTELKGILKMLAEFGYLSFNEPKYNYTLTAKAWMHIEDLKKHKTEINQGFIAMSFASEFISVGDAYKTAIRQSGYEPRRIDDKQHNNQIVPEIFFEIKRSKFVVVDISNSNNGAYYEAGYAQALEKEVIVCCRKAEFLDSEKKPHFDIAQKSMIIWVDEVDLIDKLVKRIEATVGLRIDTFG